jgi:ribonuclease R
MDKKNRKTIKGAIAVTASGSGFLDREQEESIHVPLQFLNTALNGDQVEVVLLPVVSGERIQGEVVGIIKRKKTEFVGTINLKPKNNFAFLVPDDPKMYVDIFIPNVSSKAKHRDKVLVRIKEWRNPKKNPEGEIIKVIGRKGEMDAEMESIVIEKGFSVGFSQETEKEAKEIDKKKKLTLDQEKLKRRDLRKTFTITIDPQDAKDFDDAVSFKKKNDGSYEIGVHIADVGFWVKEEGVIDREARKRGFSLYLVDRTIPMLPEVLSNDICSLNPNEDKLTFSVIMEMTSQGVLKKVEFVKTIINSNQRLSYQKAQEKIDNNQSEELKTLLSVARELRKKRISKGALDISQEEIEVVVDQKGQPIDIHIKKPLETNYLIEEFMVLANQQVALHLFNKKSLCVFRVHEKPDKDSIENLYRFLDKLGYDVSRNKKFASSEELNNLLKKIKGKDEEFLVKSVLVRSLPKAVYSIENRGHFALALSSYAHFTSPIRRYADLLVHRALVKNLQGFRPGKKETDFYRQTAEKLNQREIESASAERESIACKQVEYMMKRINNTYKGIITGVTEWGIYVAELETKAEGMVRLRSMKDDFYVLDKESFSIVGTRTQKRYSLGAKVKIKVLGGDPDKKTLDYSFV